MPYRTIYCTVCDSQLQFFRHERRNYVACPACGLGMKLAPRQMTPPMKEAASRFRSSGSQSPPAEPLPGTVPILPSQTSRELTRRALIAVAIFGSVVLMMYQLRLI